MPQKPGGPSSTRRCSARQRTDLLASRSGVPAARRTRSAAFDSKASRSTQANGGVSSAQARSSRACWETLILEGESNARGTRPATPISPGLTTETLSTQVRVLNRAHQLGLPLAHRARRVEEALDERTARVLAPGERDLAARPVLDPDEAHARVRRVAGQRRT